MMRIAATILVFLCLVIPLFAAIGIEGKQEMVQQSDLIALIEIRDITSTDKTVVVSDLIATASVTQTFKGEAKGEIKFRIPRFFPCATFDVSTGSHLVFLVKQKNGEYKGMNWFMSYVYLGGETVKWYDDKGMGIAHKKLFEEVEALIKSTAAKPNTNNRM